MLRSVQQCQESPDCDYQGVLHAGSMALQCMAASNTVCALLYIAKSENSGKTLVQLSDRVVSLLQLSSLLHCQVRELWLEIVPAFIQS